MSIVRHAGEFRDLCRIARQKYQDIHRPQIERIREL